MLFSVAVILIGGLFLGWLCKKAKIPGLFGMLIAGILMGPHVLNLIDGKILSISAEIRRIALVIILIRAGLKLSLDDLKKVGRPAVLLSFLPATVEILGMLVVGPWLLHLTLLESALLGSVIAAVSPAVVVPGMIKLIDKGYGTEKGIPQMILAGASVDDVYVIVLFTTFTSLVQGGKVSFWRFAGIPLSVVTGILAGLLMGWLLAELFNRAKIRTVVMAVILLCFSLLIVAGEDALPEYIPFASLIGVMASGLMIRRREEKTAKILSSVFDKMWIVAEVFLFTLVGASVAIESALTVGPYAVLAILMVLIVRMAGVWISLIGTPLSGKERIFTMLAYTPKATVQAAIGGVPLAMGFACGETILSVSVIAILLTAPLGAFCIDLTHEKLLKKAEKES